MARLRPAHDWPPTSRQCGLKQSGGTAGEAEFSFSTDGKRFTPLGETYQITSFGGFLGAKVGVYTSNNLKDEGFVDVDSFRYDYSR